MTTEMPPVQPEDTPQKRQKRNFALIWTALTLVIGLATFVAIFFASGLLLPAVANSAVISAAEVITETPFPTVVVATPLPQPAVVEPTATVAEVAQSPTEEATDAPEPTPEPTLMAVERTRFDFGIQIQESYDIYKMWADNARYHLHMNWVKQQVRWEDFEEVQGTYHWDLLDVVVPIAHDEGLTLMLSVVTSPEWARESGADLSKHGPPADPQNYVNFVTAIINRYKDEYPGTIGAIEVWNEMNIDREWASIQGLSSEAYVNLLAQTYNAIKAADPGVIVISGALSPSGGYVAPDGTVGAIDDFAYLDALISNGMLNYVDCVGAHHNGYNIGPLVAGEDAPNDPEAATAIFRGPFDNPHHSWSMYSTVSTYANKIQVAGSDKRLCLTEFGWAVAEDLGGFPAGFEFAQDNTLEEQAEYFVEAVQWFEESGYVWLAFVWNLNYGAQAGWDPSNDNVPYSILRPDSVQAPAWAALADYRLEHFSEE